MSGGFTIELCSFREYAQILPDSRRNVPKTGPYVDAVVLALAYRLLVEWFNDLEEEKAAPAETS